MQQAKFSLTDTLVEFVNNYQQYGFKDKSALVQAALLQYMRERHQRELEESAALYAEVYAEDADLKALTESAIEDWPE
jgi:metal-responsive CopG/Arc/MetJ family transcriptional regulator